MRGQSPAAARSRHRSRVVQLLTGGVLACAFLLCVPLASVGPEVAAAGLGNPIPANEFGDPTDEFTDDNALFVYVNSDIRGGEVCVVDGSVTSASGRDCGGPAWGGKNTVVGLGLTYALVASPPLKPGTWRLLATDQNGEGGQLSPPFHVVPCRAGSCDLTIASQVVANVKAAAARNIIGAASTCLTFAAVDLKDALVKARGRTKTVDSTAKDYSSGGGFAAAVVGGAGFGLSFVSLPSLSNPGEEKALSILKDLTCSLMSMYSDIAADPPDPNYGTVAPPSSARFRRSRPRVRTASHAGSTVSALSALHCFARWSGTRERSRIPR